MPHKNFSKLLLLLLCTGLSCREPEIVKSAEKKILSFSTVIQSREIIGVIDEVKHSIQLIVPLGTTVTAITPILEISARATVSPSVGTSMNFNSPVNYLVTAEDGSAQAYLVTVSTEIVKNTCLPKSVIIGNDSIVYEYTVNNLLAKISYHRSYKSSYKYIETDVLEHDANNRLSKMIDYDRNGYKEKSFTFSYSNNVPQRIDIVYACCPTSFLESLNFTHDSRNRLIQTEFKTSSSTEWIERFEYNDQDNVSKYFFNNFPSLPLKERLGRENITFDTGVRFYSGSGDLKLVNEYIYGYIPNKNNCTSAMIYATFDSNGLWAYTNPVTVKYLISYGSKGLVTSLNVLSTLISPPDIFFKNFRYDCQ